MSLIFKQRSTELERMDTETLDGATASHVLRNLESINHLLGGARATVRHFARFSKRWTPGQTIRVLDWGTGGADLPRALVRWSRGQGYDLRVVGIDQDPQTVAYAQAACRDYPEIEIRLADAQAFDAPNDSFDYAISSLTLHHLKDASIVSLLETSHRLAKRGIVMNDLLRSARAWAWIWTLSRVARCHSMVQHDGPLSVRRAFTAAELASYARQAGLPYLRATTHFGYRLTLAGEKS
jgi:SAM-dependent methyltransferase